VPRAHDCMTLFFGSQQRYLENFNGSPGTYYLTTGWMERGEPSGEFKQLSIQHMSGMDKSFEELVELYGEDNARYLMEQLGDQTRHYTRIAFISMGIEPDDSFQRGAEQRATERKLAFEQLQGDMRLFHDLVSGNWDDRDFLTVPAAHRIGVSEDGQRIFAIPDAP